MHFNIGFSEFRGFHAQPSVPIRPLTILIGENSSGKSSFLAAAKFVHDFFTQPGEPSFNADPFQLGTFDQITHNRGGRAGRAKEFKIQVRQTVNLVQTDSDKSISSIVDASISFNNHESGTAVSGFEIRAFRASLRLVTTAESSSWEFRDRTNKTHELEFFSGMPRSELLKVLPFVLNNIRLAFGQKSSSSEDEIPGATNFNLAVTAFLRSFSGNLKASSAIRTKPFRTYTPGIESEDGEGSHVPFELAKLARKRNKSDWEGIKGQIAEFGTESEMFNEIDVKSFGASTSDPFQIQFSFGGPKRNIVDLGYGTSQVLPLLFDSARESGRADFLIQQPEVHLHPRAQAALGQFFVNAYVSKGQHFILETHSDFIVDRIRLAMARKQIKPDEVSILYFRKGRLENSITSIILDERGEVRSPPSGYRDFFVDEQARLLGLS